MDSADTLRLKAATLLEAYFDGAIPREQYTRWDIAQNLAQRISPGDIVTREDLSMLVDQLQNPGSEFYLKALELVRTESKFPVSWRQFLPNSRVILRLFLKEMNQMALGENCL